MTESMPDGKRVSWVELYFDLIFVFAVAQTAHTIVAQPQWGGLATALGLFATLWWTWIGFVVLYNRGGEDRTSSRIVVLAGTVPCAIAAIEVHGADAGHTVGFALALAAARLVLAIAYAFSTDRDRAVARRTAAGYALSTVVFALSALTPGPWRYVLWSFALLQEAGFLLLDANRQRSRDRPARGRRLSEARADRPRRARADAVKAMMEPPRAPGLGVDSAHLAERFGLFMIILLGEIVVSVGAAALDVEDRGASYWVGLLSGLVLAAALWWIYFDSAAEVNEYVLRSSGGNPALAYGLYAGGHLGPAFSLLAIAAGVNLVLHEHPTSAAVWLVTAGLGGYLIGTRAVSTTTGTRTGRWLGLALVIATVCLALLQHLIAATGVVAVTAIWAVGIAVVVSRQGPDRLRQVTADPFSLFGRGKPAS